MKENTRCPLQGECETKCKYEKKELECDYYKANVRPGFEIEDQEKVRDKKYKEIARELEITKEKETVIQYIEIEKIWKHRDNPRKDFGDLTELADSIKCNGVLQNLTVVRNVGNITGETLDTYTCVIGHRRLEAAKLAGLDKVPCVVSEMDQHTQLQTMLMENMQRSDLTVYEQAQGFQMLMDLGDSISDVAKATGFSETTVRHRVKLLDLDQGKFRKSVERGATIMDYMELEKISDPKLKNEVLEHVGTANFNWKLKEAVEKEQKEARKAELVEILDSFAERVEKSNNMQFVKIFNGFTLGDFQKPEDAGTVKYYYTSDNYSVWLYKELKVSENQNKPELTQEQKDFKEKEEKLKELTATAYTLRSDFVKNFSAGKKYRSEIMEFAMLALIVSEWGSDAEEIAKELGIELSDPKEIDECEYTVERALMDKYADDPEKTLLRTAYAVLQDRETDGYYTTKTWINEIEHKENIGLDLLYYHLCKLGYEMSTEEKAIQDGSHELFGEPNEIKEV